MVPGDMLARRLAATIALVSAACHDPERADGASDAPRAPAASSAPASRAPPGAFVLPPDPRTSSNPLGLSAAAVPALAPGDRVFAPTERSLETARLGATLVLRSVRFEAVDGSDVLVRAARDAVPYAVHPGYLLLWRPPGGPLRRGAPLAVDHRGELRHAVFKGKDSKRLLVRLADGREPSGGELSVAHEDVAPLSRQLAPGAWAVIEGEWRHVLLVSSASHEDGKRRWLCLGWGAEAQLCDEARLRPLGEPPRRPGAPLRVAWRGTMVPATLKAVEPPGVFVVGRERTAPSLRVGPWMLMTPE
jgi:hypothetical protein